MSETDLRRALPGEKKRYPRPVLPGGMAAFQAVGLAIVYKGGQPLAKLSAIFRNNCQPMGKMRSAAS